MKPLHLKIALAAAGVAAVAAWAAQPQQKPKAPNTPESWSYEIRDGKRVPRVERRTNADGSWTEEYKMGNCTVRREGRSGEVRETRECG